MLFVIHRIRNSFAEWVEYLIIQRLSGALKFIPPLKRQAFFEDFVISRDPIIRSEPETFGNRKNNHCQERGFRN